MRQFEDFDVSQLLGRDVLVMELMKQHDCSVCLSTVVSPEHYSKQPCRPPTD
ncbi:hypothetical protein J6590_073618 [Homalodisca vitripennis]|nr:hypothetical protein J6590_073618 [Homalodisca vitripennis]